MRVVNFVASLITITQFLYLVVFDKSWTGGENIILALGIETRVVLFLLIQLLALFLAYTIASKLVSQVHEYALLLLVFGLNVILVDYASSLNFRLFWGGFDPFLPFVNRDGNWNHTIFLCFTTVLAIFITRQVAESSGWRWNN